MERAIEFAFNHVDLVGLMLVLLAALYWVESRRAGQSVSPQMATRLINQHDALVLDVRPASEYGEGHVTGAVNIPFDRITDRALELDKYKGRIIILVCKMGQHSAGVAKTLRGKGFTDVRRLSGGVSGWTAEQLPLVKS
ncbi:MAG: rhodanese-like domain-containing protein [Gammaproteobacteria bacterium]